jgi:4'-phosphopantetheinyl transferase
MPTTTIWVLETSDYTKTEHRSLLSAEEHSDWSRIKHPDYKRQFELTRAMVRRVLSQSAPAVKSHEWVFQKGAQGKPEIKHPVSPLRFNISHTQNLIAIAVSDCEVGLDVEYTSKSTDLGIAEKFFTTVETLDIGDSKDRFFEYWTLKEAFLKVIGKGFSTPLKHFTFDLGPKIRIYFHDSLSKYSPTRWKFAQMQPTDQHKMALAVETKDPISISVKKFSFGNA